ncbi:MAG: M20/M25/M40 family metallo-hydrolase [Deltaproteobacteria bacterium]|nr:M20/M25/M40 family metallo-hydrolase [Deltaproteobacteria bacterium]
MRNPKRRDPALLTWARCSALAALAACATGSEATGMADPAAAPSGRPQDPGTPGPADVGATPQATSTPPSPTLAATAVTTPTAVPPSERDPAIARAVAGITRGTFERDLRAVARPRDDSLAPTGLRQVADALERELRRAGYRVARQAVHHDGHVADNVIGERAGSDPTRVVVVGAHYDAVPGSPGADDDASGVAAMLAVARAAAGFSTRASIRIVAFAFEEDGLVGSLAYVESLPPAERSRIVAMVDLEMLGYRDARPFSQRYPQGIELIVPGRELPTAGDFIVALGLEGEAVLEALARARAYVPGLRAETIAVPRLALLAVPDLLRSDHAPFWAAGIPAIVIADTAELRNPHYHQPTDTVGTLDLDFATEVARWAAAGTLELAGTN